MKILHLCLASFYIDGYSYQENLLPKYHKRLGYDVEIIASLFSFDSNGVGCIMKRKDIYINEYGIPVTRLEYKLSVLGRLFRLYKDTYTAIEKSKPNIIFIHGCQFMDIRIVIKYLSKNPNVIVYVDNHADFSNSGKNIFSRNIMHKVFWKYCARVINPYTEKFYGVLPARVEFLQDVYKVPDSKVELLVMGVDDDLADKVKNQTDIKTLRESIGLKRDDFVILAGGKIDRNKLQILDFMKAINHISAKNINLLVFGSVIPEYKEQFTQLLNDKVKYIGWISSEEIYKYIKLADLVVFPGLHSVLWEQSVGLGKPCVFRYIEGFTHIDLGGNCKFLYEDSIEEMINVLEEIILRPDVYQKLLLNAQNKGPNKFSYKKIAAKSLNIRSEEK